MNADSSQNDRYQRQRLLPQIGRDGQARLEKARLLLVGCGALGSVLAEILVRAGVGMLRIVDRDLVDLSNLQRQFLFDERDAAQELPKAIAAAARLRPLNSTVATDPIVADVNSANIETMILGDGGAPLDLILDGTDNVATRYLINDVAVKHGIPWIYGACVGTEGRVMGVWPGQTACLRCLFPQPPTATDLPTCDTAGVLGAASAATAAIQAATAIRFLVHGIGPEDQRPGLLALDVWTGQFRALASAGRPRQDCPCCGQEKFPFLSTSAPDFTTTLCGRKAVQVLRDRAAMPIDLGATAQKWQNVGLMQQSPWFVRCRLHDPPGVELTLFPDGRLLVQGTTDPLRARSLYARFIGT